MKFLPIAASLLASISMSVLGAPGIGSAAGSAQPLDRSQGSPDAGAMIGWHEKGDDLDSLRAREQELGTRFAVIRMYNQWQVPSRRVDEMVADGRLVLSSHKPPSAGWGSIASGREDDTIRALARKYKSYGREIVFIFNHEPHDNASDVKNGSAGTADEFKAAWARLHRIFVEEGAHRSAGGNVLFGYSATGSQALAGSPAGSGDRLYPGDDLVDLLAHDRYNWAGCRNDKWESFGENWKPLVALAAAHQKPLIPAELGSAPSAGGNSRNDWFKEAAQWMKTDPLARQWMIGFSYYHSFHTSCHWDFANQGSDGKVGWNQAFGSDPYFTGTPFPVAPRPAGAPSAAPAPAPAPATALAEPQPAADEPAPVGAQPGGIELVGSSAVVTTKGTDGITLPKPSGVQAGDVLTAHLQGDYALLDHAGPAGWKLAGYREEPGKQGSQDDNVPPMTGGRDLTGYVFYKVAGPSEPSSYHFPGENRSGSIYGGSVIAWRGADQSAPIRDIAFDGSDPKGTITCPPVETEADGVRICHWIHDDPAEFDVPAGMTKIDYRNVDPSIQGGRDVYFVPKTSKDDSGAIAWTRQDQTGTTPAQTVNIVTGENGGQNEMGIATSLNAASHPAPGTAPAPAEQAPPALPEPAPSTPGPSSTSGGTGWDAAHRTPGALPSGLGEMSGFASSRRFAGWAWGVRDSGNPENLYALRRDAGSGKFTARELKVPGASNKDWEDIVYAEENGAGYLYVIDTGAKRVYKLAEPDPATANEAQVAAVYPYAFPDASPAGCGPKNNVEAAFLFPAVTGQLHLVRKAKSPAGVYRFDQLAEGRTNTPTKVGSLKDGCISVSSISADNRLLTTATHSTMRVREGNGDLASLLDGPVRYSRSIQPDNNEGGDFYPWGSRDVLIEAENRTAWHIEGTTGTSQVPSATTPASRPADPAPPAGRSAVLAAAGDVACDPDDRDFNDGEGASDRCRQGSTGRLLSSINPDAVAVLGDLQYEDGAAGKWERSFHRGWGQLKSLLRPAVGNHEYRTKGAKPYFDYFGAAAGEAGKGWYSYNLGSWHVVSINSNCEDVKGLCEPGSEQLRWLAADLAANPAKCTVAYWHHPRYSSGKYGNNPVVEPFVSVLKGAGVDIALNGHAHMYERFAPADGLRTFVVGTGGKSLAQTKKVMPGSEVRDSKHFGVLSLTLNEGSYTWQFLNEDGTPLDTGSGACQ